MSTCNRLDFQTLGSQPVMPKNLPDQWLPEIWRTYLTTEGDPVQLPSPPCLQVLNYIWLSIFAW